MARIKASTVDEYIERAPAEAKKNLTELRSILREVAPDTKEAIKWGSPVFEEKRILFAISAFKSHLNFMPTRSTIVAFEDQLKDYLTGKDTIQFPYDKPLPKELIRKIAHHRARDVRENDARWM
jgi:uncharacterized protein YdhG (YjbR/CyaY superfamily)